MEGVTGSIPVAPTIARRNMQNTAVVVGALGVIGHYIVEKLLEERDWYVIGLSRRGKPGGPRYRHIAVDLLDAEDTERKLAGLTGVTHVFYAAFQAMPGAASNFASNTESNRAMLANSVTAIDRAAPHLKRVVLVTGTKYYGVHLGPLKTPMRETDPRHAPPNYYFDQIDWLTGFQHGKAWDWVELRPQTLCGFAPGSPMSILPAIAIYAAISKELGLPLRFPGKAYDTIYQVTESTHFANAALWAAADERCANQAFNITNGDYFRWRNVWPKIAAVFDMAVGDPEEVNLTQFMADKGPLWQTMVAQHRLKPIPYADLAAWPFADYVFGANWDIMSDVTKSRLHGFHDVVDSEAMFARLLGRFRDERIVP
jgi:nucleoside-diphosphate-sugar epimerase